MDLWAFEIGAASMVGGLLLRRLAVHRRWRRWERDRRLELESYCTLEVALPSHGDPRKRTERAKRVARLMTDRSIFARSAVFLPYDAGRLVCAGSCGMDELSLEALGLWCERCRREESAPLSSSRDQLNADARTSFSVPLTTGGSGNGPLRMACTAATLIPIRLQRGKLIGLLAVCGSRESRLSAERSVEAVAALELLAAKLARTLERAMLMDRLIQVERLAGAAQLVAGVAEALIDPLRAVLDRSELIAGTSTEVRVCEHAQAILVSAEGMSETLGTLRDVLQPRAEVSQPMVERRSQS